MFEGEKILLRSYELNDIKTIMRFFNNLKLRHFIGTIIPFSEEEEKEWIRESWRLRKEGRNYKFAIEHKESKELLGGCELSNIDNINRSAILGISIYAEKNWNKGFGTDAMRVLLNFGFHYLNLHRIELFVFEYNPRAIKVYEKLGFQKVGKKRDAKYIDGRYYDSIIMDILVDEWISKKDVI
ncbi:MAG: N-acetyltransferase [Candidatus Heimdallarchaeota archaeon]|nr:N-acetyltransferase [Candidatus Heimdallarchaeota archaeon]